MKTNESTFLQVLVGLVFLVAVVPVVIIKTLAFIGGMVIKHTNK